MTVLELLAPARNKDIGVAAIDCGADAVYIAGPDFGARKSAGNPISDIADLCSYAHKFGARIFVTFNTTIEDDELREAHDQMLEAQEAGADAFIIRDTRILQWDDIRIPLHASTQCAIRDVESALWYEASGCSRIILERELSLDTIREICAAVKCEVEFFVHGALCVCYSGECRLSEHINGRSADKGDCIQACRSLYDLVDSKGKVLVKDKALLSLKDYNLRDRIEDLAEAGICSFKIEGRLKNASYVKNIVRYYDTALNELIGKYPEKYCRASFGHVTGAFVPDPDKTFNRGYTELFLDGKRKGKWSSMDTPKSMGEPVGTVGSIKRSGNSSMELKVIPPVGKRIELRNGDGFAFTTRDGITGFRGDICNGTSIKCKYLPDAREGMALYRNINSAFEKTLENSACRREIRVNVKLRIYGSYSIDAEAVSEDGRKVTSSLEAGSQTALNRERAEALLKEQMTKKVAHYCFRLSEIEVETPSQSLPLLSVSTINSIRRELAEKLNLATCSKHRLPMAVKNFLHREIEKGTDLMRSKYCIRYELGLCPRHQGAEETGPLFLLNNGRRFALGFDCRQCEMTVKISQK